MEGTIGTHCYGIHWMVVGNKVEDNIGDFD